MLHHYLEHSSQLSPGNIAIRHGQDAIAYQELDALSNRIARRLLAAGLAPGARVGICLHKSIAAVAGIFGALKAGGVYVPLDPEWPMERVKFILRDSCMSIVLLDAKTMKKIPLACQDLQTAPAWICLDEFTGTGAASPDQEGSFSDQKPANILEDPSATAYILYTSGSTGSPKGVEISHSASQAFVDWAVEETGLMPQDALSSHAPFNFDLSIFDLFGATKSGATLCLPPAGVSYFVDSLMQYIEHNQITVWYSVPSVLVQWVCSQHARPERLKSIRTLIYAGEVFHYPYLNRLLEIMPHCRILNWYGPTETNVITTYEVQHWAWEQEVPIGKACPFAELAVVDGSGHPAAPGEPGELWARTPTLMRGYWNQPEKTKACLRTLDGKSFYNTGDVVFQDADGNLVFTRRSDRMVKTRGFRVELDEVESVLGRHPQVRQALVVAVPAPAIGCWLGCWVCVQTGSKLTEEELEAFGLQHLPPYMIPEKWIFSHEIPLTSNGKADRQRVQLEFSGKNPGGARA